MNIFWAFFLGFCNIFIVNAQNSFELTEADLHGIKRDESDSNDFTASSKFLRKLTNTRQSI